MAYRIKSVKYIDTNRKILLQNENGPCPLLAAANALLLRGVITLPGPCIRNGVVSIDELINVLADRAIKRSNDEASAAANAGEWIPVGDKDNNNNSKKKKTSNNNDNAKDENQGEDTLLHMNSHEYHLDELLSLLPNLQYGMDVNPKFTSGPTGIEYTLGLTAFDLLGVELVHGWLLDPNDPQDKHTAEVIGTRTYNELIELVIGGKEAGDRVDVLSKEILERESRIEEEKVRRKNNNNVVKDGKEDCDVKVGKCEGYIEEKSFENESVNKNAVEEKGEDWINVEKQADTGELHTNDGSSLKAEENLSGLQKNDASPSAPPSNDAIAKESDESPPPQKEEQQNKSAAKAVNDSTTTPLSDEEITTLTHELSKLKTQYNEISNTATNGTVINTFLSSTSHQLTYHGLHELHKFVAEQSLCVFFRNNHFATLTKQHGILYLLVTDLGYANVPEVVWEKLDAIDGDTEYADEYFAKPKPRKTLAPAAGLNLNPEDVLAQRSRSEADYQLALQLSKGKGNVGKTQTQLDEEEGRLMAAATEASLMEYNKNNGGGSDSASNHGGVGTVVPIPSPQQQETSSSANNTSNDNGVIAHDVDSDREMALALQAQLEADHESEQLARRLQNEENQRQRQQQQQQQRMASPTNRARNNNTSSSSDGGKSSCIIS